MKLTDGVRETIVDELRELSEKHELWARQGDVGFRNYHTALFEMYAALAQAAEERKSFEAFA